MKDQRLKIKDANQRLKIFFRSIYLLFLICIFAFSFLIFNLGNAVAQNSSSQNYNLEINDIDTSPDKLDNPQPIIPVFEKPLTPVETLPGGIKNISQTAPILFSVSSEIIDFGTLSPGNPVTRNTILSVLSNSVGYQILSFEDHPLIGPDNQTIADTTCDNGSCSEREGALWVNQLTYGLGFRCDSKIDFLCLSAGAKDGAEDNYRQFADLSKQEAPQSLISGVKSEKTKDAQITFKLNTSGNQKTGSYANTVTFILVPNY
ncbi:MAG TPA: hypothetical protein VNA13_01865 [Xanthomonadales bacterium]|nr:hypothetical protein [Xanthomonadales bacterium]